MASKENVDIKRSDQFQEVDEELSRAMAELDFTIERVSAIFDGSTDENVPSVSLPPAKDSSAITAEPSDTRDGGNGAGSRSEPDDDQHSKRKDDTTEVNRE